LLVLSLLALAIPTRFIPIIQTAEAASTSVVISEFRTRGPNGAADEFVELYNLTANPINIGGWKINRSNGSGAINTQITITAGTMIPAHGHFLATNSAAGGYSGSVPANQSWTVGITDDGGVGLLDAANNIIDQVGMSAGSAYKEGTVLSQLTTSVNRSHERKPGGANGSTQDTDNNATDFQLITPSDPQNLSSAPTPAGGNQAIAPNCPAGLNTVQGTPASVGVSATDPDGTVTSATITSAPVIGIALSGFTPAPSSGGTASATLNVANTTAAGTYNVVIQYSNNDSPTPQTASCTVVVTVTAPNQAINTNCPTPLATTQGIAASVGVSATDPDGTVTSATITSANVPGITLDNFVPGGTATATLNVANTTAPGTYNVVIQYSNNDSPTPQTATCAVAVTVNPPPTPAAVVISQVYGGGGNTGSTLKNDYIELVNHSGSPVNLSGWSVQAFVSNPAPGAWVSTPLPNFTLQPGQYFLIQESQGAGGTDNLPTPDATGTIAVSSTSTKVALVSNNTTLTGVCPNASAAGIVDLVGYGAADCFEGSAPAPVLTNTTAALRLGNGCFDTDDNAHDFVAGAPNPRNSSSPTNVCTGLSGYGFASPRSVVVGASTLLTVYAASAQDPTSTGVMVTADLTAIGGSNSQVFSGSGSTYTFNATVPANNSTGPKILPVTITDLQGRTGSTSIAVKVLPVIPDHVTISQLYGGGGNGGATYNHDYVELYNPSTTATVDLTGWSLQYGAATGDTWQVQPLGGIIGPGEYYLIALATNNNAIGTPLPPANVSGDVNMAAAAGKVALVNSFDALVGPCPIEDAGLVDFLGYGTTANCAEGTRAAAPSATIALYRKTNGGTDTDNNLADFVTGAPSPRRTAPIVEIGPAVFATDPRGGANSAPRDDTITINFTEPVTVDSAWYDINCASTGNHNSATVRSFFGGDAFTITPNANFLAGEQCTVTIFKDAIHDVDTDDSGTNADTLPANKTFTFTVANGTAPPYPASVHTTMGNPSGANAVDENNYLMEKPEYTVSYNRSRGGPNWVSWHLSDDWIGTLARVDSFRADPAVPADWYRVSGLDYTGSGFDRGHLTPNADRDKETSPPINQATFLMTNMIPQAPDNNQGPWANLEGYLRTLTPANEIYIIAGGAGTGGVGSNGAATTIAGGNVTVPARTWKVALIIPKASGDDVSRVNCSTRALAVNLPNIQGIRNDDWENYITTVDAVEALTGYDFFSNLPENIQGCIEAGTNGVNPPGTADQSASTFEDTPVTITLEAVRPNNNTPTFSVVSGPQHGTLGAVSAASCSGDHCTATVTYTPGADYDGPDSFDFKARDGALDSNVSTVSITVVGDEDGDGVPDASDNCPSTANPDQADFDHDGAGNVCDADDDNDGQTDADEIACGSDPQNNTSKATDTDGDNSPDCVDNDDDNDGVPDAADAFPLDPNESVDTDHDGIGNNADTDDDGDGQSDADELACGSDPLSAASLATDTDGDHSPDCVDNDDDNDGVLDVIDNCPLTFNPDQADFDHDGVGDTCDPITGPPTTKEQCQNGGWQRFDSPRLFKNQGDCIQFVNTGK
jgi:endonuclease G